MTDLQNASAMEGLSEERLAALARDGSEDAFALLVHRSAGMIQQQAARYRSAWVEAEDLAQEGLLGLLAAVRTFREEGGASFRTYAAVCIRHRMISAVRGGGSEQLPLELDDSTEEPVAPGSLTGGQADPAQLIVQREETARLRRCLREVLTELEYEVLMLYLSAYTYEEIAGRLSLGTKAVDNALQRVRRKLAGSSLLDGGIRNRE